MSKASNYEVKTKDIVLDIIKDSNIGLYDVEFVKEVGEYYLRVYIEKDEGVAIEDCEFVSEKLSSALDEDDFIDEAYILEVSSPGLTRPLKREIDFIKNIGKKVEFSLYKGGSLEGILKSYENKVITIDVCGEDRIFKKEDFSYIKLAFDMEKGN